ncbi:sugar phosphate isomerase/epimerase [Thermoactinomyces sp. CICC 10523]|uniref:sugar phosphate isomerase/epimerase family protein n=1 Tax=Thermoactinomyces sp. CICC 10523 TaxID=2767428 RepID=UPI0018DEBE1A|nr:TIM barrel protein [Thermoactinomyces sp. CICC 10523]MBH8599051.1 sugar phosphate isomerase/epimerase [Thermoactinomyces sp. CICC 10523]
MMDNLSFITDEYSDSIDEAITFAVEAGINLIELRTANKRNLLDFPMDELKDIAKKIKNHNLCVSCLASPLLKWHPDHIEGLKIENARFHSFKYNKAPKSDVYQKAFEIADLFQTQFIRIFSYLMYPGFQVDDLMSDVELLIHLACQYDKTLLIENEPVCNIDKLGKLYEFVTLINSPRVCALVDVGNLYEMGHHVDYDDLKRLAPFIRYLHIKDYSIDLGQYVTVGDGDVDVKEYFQELSRFVNLRQLPISLETHVREEKKVATERSIKYVKDVFDTLNIS